MLDMSYSGSLLSYCCTWAMWQEDRCCWNRYLLLKLIIGWNLGIVWLRCSSIRQLFVWFLGCYLCICITTILDIKLCNTVWVCIQRLPFIYLSLSHWLRYVKLTLHFKWCRQFWVVLCKHNELSVEWFLLMWLYINRFCCCHYTLHFECSLALYMVIYEIENILFFYNVKDCACSIWVCRLVVFGLRFYGFGLDMWW